MVVKTERERERFQDKLGKLALEWEAILDFKAARPPDDVGGSNADQNWHGKVLSDQPPSEYQTQFLQAGCKSCCPTYSVRALQTVTVTCSIEHFKNLFYLLLHCSILNYPSPKKEKQSNKTQWQHTQLQYLHIFQYPSTTSCQLLRQSRSPLVQTADHGKSCSTTPGRGLVPMRPQSSSYTQLLKTVIHTWTVPS